ncbi:hypothetical protein NBRC111894_1523 [Sporolactobacillus inulinus]|uniref:Uncharacterized protein n=1 Tax=Sporolactobacillus inulinus TaxID=2078 RepID=A0A4Y1ZAA4_9BACL|nr:hypothetical protein NBRC111894_1523 [Sporolactobacillus inulinus]
MQCRHCGRLYEKSIIWVCSQIYTNDDSYSYQKELNLKEQLINSDEKSL